jgi:hypothetical protein
MYLKPSIVYHILTFEFIAFGVDKNMNELHFLNDNNTLVIIILLFYNIVEKKTFIQQRNWWIYAQSAH